MRAVWRIALAICLLLSAMPASAQGLIGAATQAKDLTFPTTPSTGPVDGSRMVLLKPDGPGPFPAMVLQHQCGGLRSKRGPNRSMGTWAKAAVEQGFVVLLIDSLGPRDVDQVCMGPKNGVNLPRGVRDALQAADHLRTLAFVDKRRVAHVGFSWGAMMVLLAGNASWHSVLTGGQGFTAAVSVYPPCFEIRPPSGMPYEVVQNRIDRPTLVLMGGKDVETPASECVPKLQAAKDSGAPLEWYVFKNATHCWDCQQLDGFSKIDIRGTNVTYHYDSAATSETRRRIFEFLERTWTTGQKAGRE